MNGLLISYTKCLLAFCKILSLPLMMLGTYDFLMNKREIGRFILSIKWMVI